MNILYHHRTQGAGVEGVHIRGMIEAFRKLGHTVVVVSPPGIDPFTTSHNYIKPSRIALTLKMFAKWAPETVFEFSELAYNFWAYNKMAKLVKEQKFDIIYERYALNTLAGLKISKRYGIPLILEVNDSAGITRVRKLKVTGIAKANERKIFSGANKIVTISSYFKNIIAKNGVPANKIYVIPNAVDDAKILFDDKAGARIRQKYFLGNKTVIGYVGSFLEWHGVDLLLNSFKQLVEKNDDVRLLLVGSGLEFENVRKLADSNGLKNLVIFTGKVPHDDISSYIQAMDICVIPDSNVYGSPMKLFEYMAGGKAIVAPRLLPMEDVVDSGNDGVLFRPGDKEALSSVLAQLADNSDVRNRIGKLARNTVIQRHTWTRNAEKVIDIYKGDQ